MPIIGWVVDSRGPELLIRLKTGPTVSIPNRDDLAWGDPVRVCYDYENMRVRQVLSLNQIHDQGIIKEVQWGEADLPWDDPEIEELLEVLTR